jgi:lysophospholipase L1-like esterase
MTSALAQTPAGKDQVDVVLIGDSITWAGKWESRFPGLRLVNRAVPGYKTADVLHQLDSTIALKPKKAILMIGINDLLGLAPVDKVYDGIVAIVRRLQADSIPVVMLATLECSRKSCVEAVDWVRELNRKLKVFAQKETIPFIDLNPKLAAPDSGLLAKYTWDGLHLSEPAYVIWADAIRPYLQ